MIAQIRLSNGMVALVDDADVPLVSRYHWGAFQSRPNASIYAVAWDGCRSVPMHRLRMHRLILGASQGQLVDHRNGNSLDNRRTNLRIADHSGNAANLFARRSATGFKGVAVNRAGRFRAQIHVRGRDLYLGLFETPEDAAAAYAAAALAHFGEFANIDVSPASRPGLLDLADAPLGAVASRDTAAQPETPDRAVSRIDVDGRVSPHPLADVDRPHLTPVPASSAAASRRDAPSFAVALAARPDVLPARRSPDVHGPDG